MGEEMVEGNVRSAAGALARRAARAAAAAAAADAPRRLAAALQCAAAGLCGGGDGAPELPGTAECEGDQDLLVARGLAEELMAAGPAAQSAASRAALAGGAVAPLAAALLSDAVAGMLACISPTDRTLVGRVLRVGPVTSVLPALVAALARAADAHSGGTGAAGELAEAVLCDALGTGLIASLLAEASETRRGDGALEGARGAEWRAALDALVGASDRAEAAAAVRGVRPAAALRGSAIASAAVEAALAVAAPEQSEDATRSGAVTVAAEMVSRFVRRGQAKAVARALREGAGAHAAAASLLMAMPDSGSVVRVSEALLAAVAPACAFDERAMRSAVIELRALWGAPRPGSMMGRPGASASPATLGDVHAHVVDVLLAGGRLKAPALRLAVEVAAAGAYNNGIATAHHLDIGDASEDRDSDDERALRLCTAALSEAWALPQVASAMPDEHHGRVTTALAACLVAGGARGARTALPAVLRGVSARLECSDAHRRRAGMRLATLVAALSGEHAVGARGDGTPARDEGAPVVFECEPAMTAQRCHDALWDVDWWGGHGDDPRARQVFEEEVKAVAAAASAVPAPPTDASGRGGGGSSSRNEQRVSEHSSARRGGQAGNGGSAGSGTSAVSARRAHAGGDGALRDPHAPANFFVPSTGVGESFGVRLDADSDDDYSDEADVDGYSSESSLEAYALSDEEDARPIETLEEKGVRKTTPVSFSTLVSLLKEGRKDPYSLEAALRGAEAVIRSRPAELGSGAAEELALTLLTTRPEIDDDTWGSGDEAATGGEAHRRAALMALLVCYPQDCAEALAARLASAHLDAAQRLALLDAMEGAARELSGVFVATDRRTTSRGSSARSSVADVGAHSSDGRLEAVLAGESQLTHDGRPRVRRWGHRVAALRAEAESRGGQTHRQGGRNDFGPLAPLFALPLMACFDRGEPGTGADLLHAPNAPVLARLLLALGSFAQCAGVYPTAVPVAASLLELLSAVSERAMGPAYVDEAAGISVARAMLAAQAMAVGALPPPAVAAAFEGGGELVAILEAAGARAAAAAEGLGAFGGDESVVVLGQHCLAIQSVLMSEVAGPQAPSVEDVATIRMPSMSAF